MNLVEYSKVSLDNLLVLIPSNSSQKIQGKNQLEYCLKLPDDDTLFRVMIIRGDKDYLLRNDIRENIFLSTYQICKTSDKGRYLQGIIAMFDSLHEAYRCLTNKLWRIIIREVSKNSDKVYSFDKLLDFYSNSKETISRLEEKLRIKKKGSKYRKLDFTDSLEFLVHIDVFYQVSEWKCEFCGYCNIRSLDNLKKIEHCEICKTIYMTPIDLQWKYKINNFVSNALCASNNGLSVLWALGFLHDRYGSGSFYYIPELDLFEKIDNDKKNEIDLICVFKGRLHVVEIKKTATSFILSEREINKYIEIIKNINPDVALLMFEQYCETYVLSKISDIGAKGDLKSDTIYLEFTGDKVLYRTKLSDKETNCTPREIIFGDDEKEKREKILNLKDSLENPELLNLVLEITAKNGHAYNKETIKNKLSAIEEDIRNSLNGFVEVKSFIAMKEDDEFDKYPLQLYSRRKKKRTDEIESESLFPQSRIQ